MTAHETAVSIVRTLLGLLFDHTIGNIVRMIPIIRLPKLERGPVSRGFLALLLGILFFGLTMLFSASYSSAYATSGKLYSIIKPQVMIALVGLAFMWILSNINYRALRLMSESLYIMTIVLLILALFSRRTPTVPTAGCICRAVPPSSRRSWQNSHS